VGEKKFKITLTQYMDGPLAEYLAELSGPTPVGVIVRFFCFLKKDISNGLVFYWSENN
jgi:hypothetical protein